MNSAEVALGIIGLIIFGTIGFALFSVRRFRMEPQEFIVGNRSFGALLMWILLAGEVYTSFSFLGAAGWAYGKGAPSFYIIAYFPIGEIIGYFYLPVVWRLGKARGYMTWPDFLNDRYGSKSLATAVALLQFVLMVPYVTLQLTGLQILLTVAGYGQYDANIAVGAAFALVVFFVFTAGLRGAAWASVVKDGLVLCAAAFAGIYLPVYFFGSPANMFSHLLQTKPGWVTFGPGTAPYGIVWYISTVLLNSLGAFMFPQSIQSIFSARDENAVRRNLIFLPVYNVVIVLMLFAGFAALLVAPGLQGPAADRSFVIVLQRFFPAWVVGLVCGAGCLAALLPASVLLLGAASVVSRNVARNTRWVRPAVLACGVLAFVLWFFARATLVDLLLFVYNGITQLVPGVLLGLVWKRVTATAVWAGLIAGEGIAVYTVHAAIGPAGINPGLIALLVNATVCVVVTLCSPRQSEEFSDSVVRPSEILG